MFPITDIVWRQKEDKVQYTATYKRESDDDEFLAMKKPLPSNRFPDSRQQIALVVSKISIISIFAFLSVSR
jgi:hypothetical protein